MSRGVAPSGRTRLSDVAAAAGVSAMTVSRALRQPDRLSPRTLQRIQAKIRELGYLPNESARALTLKRSRIVAAVVPTLSYSVYAGTLQGLADGLRCIGFELMLGDSGYNARNERKLVEAFIARGVDALVLTGVEHDRAVGDLVLAHALQVVEVWDLGRRPLGLCVGFSNRAAGRAVGELLASLGRRNWGFIGTVPAREQRSRKRMEGFRQAARDAGLPRPRDALVENAMQIGQARAAAQSLLSGSGRLDAVFCANDLLACGLLQVAKECGRKIPDDLAVVGFGDFDIASIVAPSLTTIRIPGYRMGLVAAESLLAADDAGRAVAGTIDLGFELVRRETA